MLEEVWNTFDALFKSVQSQGRRINELEERIAQLEKRLEEQSRPVLTLVDNTPKRQEGRP